MENVTHRRGQLEPQSSISLLPNGSSASISRRATGSSEHFGWTDLIYTHISARVPDEPGHFLLNRFGLLFDEVTASNLIKVDLDGNLVDEPDAPMHRAGFVIHSAIHGGRDDVDCVIHTHSKAGVAVAAMKDGLLPLSQHAQLFFGRVSYHDYEGLAIDIDERQRLVRDLGSNPVMILRNHGLLAVGTSIPLAFSNLFNLQFALRDAGSGDGGKRRPEPALARRYRSTRPSSPSHRKRPSARNGRGSCASSTAWTRPTGRDNARVRNERRNEPGSPARLRLLAGGSERHRRRERLGIDLEMEDRGLAGFLRRLERGQEIRGLLHRRAVAAEGARIGGEIRILQTGSRPRGRDNGAPGACGWCRTCRCRPPR